MNIRTMTDVIKHSRIIKTMRNLIVYAWESENYLFFLDKSLILILRSSVQYHCHIQMFMLVLSVGNIFKVKPLNNDGVFDLHIPTDCEQ